VRNRGVYGHFYGPMPYAHCDEFCIEQSAKLVGKLRHVLHITNPLIATLKPQSNGPSYSNTLAVDGWDVTIRTARRGLGGAAARQPLLAVQNVTAHPSTASVPTSYYSMLHYNCFWTLKG